jgi:hypothetical protein
MPRNSDAQNRKAKKSFTLSVESVEFLDAILRGARIAQEKAAIHKTISDYSSSLSTQETKEQTLWGDLAQREFPNERRSAR